jgi:peptidyl-prolyl cis-trans isomerase D
MLETFRKNSRSVIIYVLFGILIAVFIISFGPQAGARRKTPSGGCGHDEAFAVKVKGHAVSENSWRYAIMSMYGSAATGEKARAHRVRETVMDKLIERELLAQAAEDAGFRISTQEAEARIARGEAYLFGEKFPEQIFQKDGVFDYDTMDKYVKNALSLASVPSFVEEQQREFLAQDERDLLEGAVRVSPEELLQRYTVDNTRVEVDYVKFKPIDYRHTIDLSDADVDAYLAAHDADVKKKFDLDKNLYAAAGGKWVELRQIMVRKGPAVNDEDKKAAPDPKRAVIEGALARIKSGEDFAKVAKEVSEDERSAKRGGLADWRQTSKLDAKLSDAIGKLTPGAGMTEVVETPSGYYVAQVVATSDQDLTYDQVKKDLAEPMARDDRAKAKAREDAETALAKIKSGTSIDALFEPAVKPGAPAGATDDNGEGDVEVPPALQVDHPGDPAPEPVDKPGDQPPTPTPTPDKKDTAPAPAPDKKDEKKDEKKDPVKKTGMRRHVFARPQAEGAPRPVTPPPAPVKVVETQPTKAEPPKKPEDKKPEAKKPPVGAPDPDKDQSSPKLQKSGPLFRNGVTVRGIGESKELTKAIFKEIKVGDVGPQVYETDADDSVNDAFVIVRVTVRTDPDMADYEKQKESLASGYAHDKYNEMMKDWLQRRCLETRPDISVNSTYVEYGDSNGTRQKSTYQPCTSSLSELGGQQMIIGPNGEPIDLGDLQQQ